MTELGLPADGRQVLVTGASGTIGAAVVSAFRTGGAEVVAADRRAEEGVVPCDVTDEGQVRRLLREELGRLGHVVHAAGMVHTGSVADTDLGTVELLLRVNLFATFVLGHVLLPVLPSGGSFTVIASQAARHGAAGWGPYSASKAGVLRFVESAAKEAGPRGVRVNAVNPGSVRGPVMVEVADATARRRGLTREQVLAGYAESSPLRCLIAPEDVAHACVFLASPWAARINGAALDVDGGEAPG